MSTASARRLPVRTALSGPAAGVIAAAAIAKAAGFANVITADLGGTSFDVSLIAKGEAALAAQTTIDFGLVIRTPMIEITTIGAGGGSIAHVDRGGLLQVGPESAGSVPGPVCYGAGRRAADPDRRACRARPHQRRAADRRQARAARRRGRAARHPARMSASPWASTRSRRRRRSCGSPTRAWRARSGSSRSSAVTIPAHFALMPFGGGGALHAAALIREVGLKAALVPRFPGVTSALGCVIADLRHDHVRTVNLMLDGLDATALDQRLADEGREVAGGGRERRRRRSSGST